MNIPTNKRLKILVLATAVGAATIFSTAAFANGNVQNFIEKVFISEEDSQKALEKGKALTKQNEDFEKEQKALESEIVKQKGEVEELQIQSADSDISKLPAKQKDEILKLRKQSDLMIGKFVRQEKIIKGELTANHKRIKLDEVKGIISKNNKFEDVVSQVSCIQGAPDFAGGSGVSLQEFWMDDAGSEKVIVIMEQKEIIYSKKLDDSKGEITEKLF